MNAGVTQVPQAPLVSIVTRTLGRDCLAEAAASVAAQDYRPIEWVVVDAAGNGNVTIEAGSGAVTRVVGTGQPLLRSAAANVGLAACTGHWIALLDDDDLLRPDHVARLVAALVAAPDAQLAYADAEAWRAPETIRGYYSFGFSHLLLTRRNLFPPNAALFDAALVHAHGVRFDNDLDFFEDWDFWLQCARHTRFVRVTGPTAIYRSYLSGSGIEAVDSGAGTPRMLRDRDIIRQRYTGDRTRLQTAFAHRKRAATEATAARDAKRAAALWRDVFVADPYDPDAGRAFARCAQALGEPALACQILQQSAELNPREPSLWWELAGCLDAQHDPAAAASARKHALQLDPSLAAPAALKA
jgi:hypothetical protein